jgi:sugar lactone lactonase YvrE
MIRRFLIMLFLLTGCQLAQATNPTLSPAATAVTLAANAATMESTGALTSEAMLSATGDDVRLPTPTPTAAPIQVSGVLAWLGTGASPAHATGGQIALIDRAGTIKPLMDVPNTAARVTACGDQATSPDGRYFAYYVGADAGKLYVMDAAKAPVLIDDVSFLACLSTFHFAPDSHRFAYIDYPSGATTSDYASGTLRLYATDTLQQAASFDHVVAYSLTNNGAMLVSFFNNSKAEADEADISLWDGTTVREIVTLVPTEPECRFTSAQIALAGSQLLALMGQRCTTGDGRTNWQLYTIDAAAGSATLIGTDAQPGAFVTFARTNNLYFAPNGSTAYFTVPDAVTGYTVAVASVSLSDYSINVPVDRQAVFPNFSGAPDAFPRLSPDGRWLAMVITSPDNENQVLALDLNAPDASPVTAGAHSRGDVIPDMAFGPDNRYLYYIAGGGDNSVFSLDLTDGTEKRLVRGNFAEGMALAPDAKTVALLNLTHVDDPKQPGYINLVLADLATGSLTTLAPGADVADGKVTNLRFAYPLTWR